MIGALGVAFGDIGTSPLYALQTVLTIDDGAVEPTPDDVYGVISLMFWAVTLVVSIKYVMVVMRADNEGEGGVITPAISVLSAMEGLEVAAPGLSHLVLPPASSFWPGSVAAS